LSGPVQEAEWPRRHGGGTGAGRAAAEFAILRRADTTEIGRVSTIVKSVLSRLGPGNLHELSEEVVRLEIKSMVILERVRCQCAFRSESPLRVVV
jgi:hypothetical protein